MKANQIVDYVNLPKHISRHLFGRNHTGLHRRFVGFVLAFLGVNIATLFHEYWLLHVFMDLFGYTIHGSGIIPFIEYYQEQERLEYCKTHECK